MENSLGVIHPFDGDDQAFAFVSPAKFVPALSEFFGIHGLLELRSVDADWINTERRGVTVSGNLSKLSLDPQQPPDGATEMSEIIEGVKADPICAEHPRNQFATARMESENLRSRKRCVQKETDLEIWRLRAQREGEQHQLIVMHPDQVAILRCLQHFIGKSLINLLIILPPLRFVPQIVR